MLSLRGASSAATTSVHRRRPRLVRGGGGGGGNAGGSLILQGGGGFQGRQGVLVLLSMDMISFMWKYMWNGHEIEHQAPFYCALFPINPIQLWLG